MHSSLAHMQRVPADRHPNFRMGWFADNKLEVPAWAWAVVGAGVAAAAVIAARRQAAQSSRDLLLRSAITIQAPAARLYELWRDPQVHAQLRKAKVTPLGENGSSWRFRRDFSNGGHIEGEIHLTCEQPPERLEWATENLQLHFRPGLPIRHLRVSPRGLLQLRPAPTRTGEADSTEVQLRFAVQGASPLPWVRARIAAGMRTSLRRLRALAETGTLATTTGQPAGRRSRKGLVLLRILEGPQLRAGRKVS